MVAKSGSIGAKIALMAGAVAVTMPAPAAACIPNMPIVVRLGEPPDNRRECRKVLRNTQRYAARIVEGRVPTETAQKVASDLLGGGSQCPEDRAAAFQLYDAIAGYPTLDDPESVKAWELIGNLRNLKDYAPTDQRGHEVQALDWLVNGGYPSQPPEGYSEAELTELLMRPHFFDHAVRYFDHSPRTALLTNLLLDPQSPLFDIEKIVDRTIDMRSNLRFFGRDRRARTALAIRLDDPKFGKPDYDRFAKLLIDYDPYHLKGLSAEMHSKAAALWVRIAQSRLSSSAPEVKRQAEMTLRTGDPTLEVDPFLSPKAGGGAQVVMLDEWPEQTAPLKYTERWVRRVAENYPSRALRQEIGGRVELGVVFGPGGDFHSLQITRSAGQLLDGAAKKGIQRYMRPRLKEMKLAGFEGQYVYAPLPSIEFHIGKRGEEFSGLVDPQTIVVAVNRLRSSCGEAAHQIPLKYP